MISPTVCVPGRLPAGSCESISVYLGRAGEMIILGVCLRESPEEIAIETHCVLVYDLAPTYIPSEGRSRGVAQW